MNPAIVSAIKDYQSKPSLSVPVSRIGLASLPELNINATKQPTIAPATYASM